MGYGDRKALDACDWRLGFTVSDSAICDCPILQESMAFRSRDNPSSVMNKGLATANAMTPARQKCGWRESVEAEHSKNFRLVSKHLQLASDLVSSAAMLITDGMDLVLPLGGILELMDDTWTWFGVIPLMDPPWTVGMGVAYAP